MKPPFDPSKHYPDIFYGGKGWTAFCKCGFRSTNGYPTIGPALRSAEKHAKQEWTPEGARIECESKTKARA